MTVVLASPCLLLCWQLVLINNEPDPVKQHPQAEVSSGLACMVLSHLVPLREAEDF